MKTLIIIIFAIFLIYGSTVQGQNSYYWYGGSKIKLKTISSKKFVTFDTMVDTKIIKQKLKIKNHNLKKLGKSNILKHLKPHRQTKKTAAYWAIISDTEITNTNIDEFIYEIPYYSSMSGGEIGISNLFYVQLKEPRDLILLENMAKKNKVEILGNDHYMPLWYTLSCDKKSKGTALEMANLFYESGLFVTSEPDLMIDDLTLGDTTQCVNDPLFNDQWNLNNTGQNGGTAGIDINFCESSQITTGSGDIVIAVVDGGIQFGHPDLLNLYEKSYDTETDNALSQIRHPHGTACAGIIGARNNNTMGVSGIAPNCPLMSISDILHTGTGASLKISKGINFAWENGASVISNSWGDTDYKSTYVDTAIARALNLGRSGLGTVVVFAAGNDGEDKINYPARAHDDILAVGAISPCGERKNPNSCEGNPGSSSYGTKLDIVAPGILIPTTDLSSDTKGINVGYNHLVGPDGDYYLYFGGTSAATPHVAAVAGLVLSINPKLTQKEVANIIEKTAQKVGDYNYQTVSGRNNGAWNEEMGYGLVDAYAAVVAAQNSLPPAPPIPPDCPDNITLPNTTISSGESETHQASNTIENSTTYIIEDGGTVTLKGNEIILNPGFEAEEGSTFEATVDPCE